MVSRPTDAQSVTIEADALAYLLDGYSGIVNLSFDNGLSIALGAGRYNVPGFVVEGQENFDEAGWKARSESIQVLRRATVSVNRVATGLRSMRSP
jgi:hypothetical protein